MLDSKGLNLAKPYLDEESNHLSQTLKDIPDIQDYSFISIGAGPLLHLETSLSYVKHYIAVDPQTPLFLARSNHCQLIHRRNNRRDRVRILPKFFEEGLLGDIGAGKNIFFFAFNVYSYIQDPLYHLSSVLRKGDVVIVSLWSELETAAAVSKPYFEYVNQVRLDEPRPKGRGVCQKGLQTPPDISELKDPALKEEVSFNFDEIVIPTPKTNDWQALPNFEALDMLEGQINKFIVIST